MFTCNPANELEVEQMILWRKHKHAIWSEKIMVSHLIAHSRVGIDLQGVIVCCAVLEQSIVRVEHLLEIVDVTLSHNV